MREFDLEWQRRKFRGGWAGLAWPQTVGGRGLSLVQQMIWYEESARAEAPGLGCLSIALNHAGPTLIGRGTEAQKALHLPKILAGEVVWCQGFSEPNAGSDLAALKLAGRLEDDHIVVSGQKIWSSHAQIADYQELLVRTDATLGRHKGITWVICDMRSAGITVRPINTLAGDQHFCEVFYQDVEIPLTSVVGEVNDGWRVAMTTLANERGGTTLSHAAELGHIVDRLIALARERTDTNGRPMAQNEAIAARLAEHRAEVAALGALSYSLISGDQSEAAPGSNAAVTFLFYGELLQRVRLTGLEVLGVGAIELSGDADPWTRGWLADRMMVIAGGSAQVRKNIIAERILGLPRSY
jgi:alkylation response protein AidB-like acyl-CoA dehydrogenase